MSLQLQQEGELLRSIFTSKGVNYTLADSYNHFLHVRMGIIVGRTRIQLPSPENIIRTLIFSDVQPKLPLYIGMNGKLEHLYPMDARRKGLSYMSDVFATVTMVTQDLETGAITTDSKEMVPIASVPIMYGCSADRIKMLKTPEERRRRGEGDQDTDGYFIINGAEKVLLHLDKLRKHFPLLFLDRVKSVKTTTRPRKIKAISEINEKDSKGLKPIVRYTSKTLDGSTIITVHEMMREKGYIACAISGIEKVDINILYIFYALGVAKGDQSADIWIESVLKRFDSFIVDSDRVKDSEKRRRNVRYAFQSTINIFLRASNNGEQILSMLAESSGLHLKDPDRENNVVRTIREKLFLNMNEKGISEAVILDRKINMLSYMTVKFLLYKVGYIGLDDRDSWSFKRVEDPAEHMEAAFIKAWRSLVINTEKSLANKRINTVDDAANQIRFQDVREALIKNFSSEVWSKDKNADSKRNVTIVDSLKRETILSAYSHVRKINTPTSKNGAIRDKRMMVNSQWGVICPVKTPEGATCGLVRSAAVTTIISVERDYKDVFSIVNDIDVKLPNGRSVKLFEFSQYTVREKNGKRVKVINSNVRNRLFINGVPFGFCNGKRLYNELKMYRRNLRRRTIPHDTGLILDESEDLWIYTDAGRFCRPLLIVKHDRTGGQRLVIDELKMRGSSFQQLLNAGCIEYIDIAEQNQPTTNIALTSKDLEKSWKVHRYNYCELDPNAILGVSASIIPFMEFMQGPRSAFQAHMGEQASTSNPIRNELRFDTTMVSLLETGVPFVSTDFHDVLGMDKYPQGRNVIIAIMTYGGGNQEDAVIFNRKSIDMGLFKMAISRKYETEIETSKKEIIKIPELDDANRFKYRNLETDPSSKMYGVVKVGAFVRWGDVLIAKAVKEGNDYKSINVVVGENKEGQVDEVIRTVGNSGKEFIRVRVIEIRDIQAGDKLASRYSQKGIIGRIMNDVDMPVMVSNTGIKEIDDYYGGVTPDIIFNPHSIPSRMTNGKLMEILTGNWTLLSGERVNATAFRGFKYQDFIDNLRSKGFSGSGNVQMMNGMTGKLIQSEIFVGPVYYQSLQHLVQNKMQARSTGPIDIITRQPNSGMRNDGGLRFGIMETDSLKTHGAPAALRDRTMLASDKYTTIVCTECGQFAIPNPANGEVTCRNCDDGDFAKSTIPYIFKVFTQYLSAASIKVDITTST